MLLAHKIELRPTEQQADYLDRACGSRRHAFNQLLAHFSQEGVRWSKQAAHEKYKELRIEFPWYAEVSQRVTRNTVDDLHNAFTHFFRRVKNGNKAGYPRFKKRGLNDSFSLRENLRCQSEAKALAETSGTKTTGVKPQNEGTQPLCESQASHCQTSLSCE